MIFPPYLLNLAFFDPVLFITSTASLTLVFIARKGGLK
jgi:hypothetical protein